MHGQTSTRPEKRFIPTARGNGSGTRRATITKTRQTFGELHVSVTVSRSLIRPNFESVQDRCVNAKYETHLNAARRALICHAESAMCEWTLMGLLYASEMWPHQLVCLVSTHLLSSRRPNYQQLIKKIARVPRAREI